VGNWEIAPIYFYESPELFTVQSGIDSNLNGDAAGDRAIANPNGGPSNTSSSVYGLTRGGAVVPVTAPTAQIDTVAAWVATNPGARYIQAGYGAVTNVGRNTLPIRPINNLDLTLLKRFNLTERIHIDFSGEALNLFNHPQFIPGTVDQAQLPSNSTIFTPGVHSFVTTGSSTFDNPEATFSSNPRTLLITAKLYW